MSFINWGHESPEQRAARARMEMEALYEQAVRLRMQSQGGVGGSGIRYSKPQAITTSQSVLIVFNELNKPTFQYYLADFENENIAGPFDTGVSTTDYSIDNLERETIQYGGYALKFYRPDINEHTMLFINSAGSIVETVVGISTDITIDSYEGKFIAATDFDEGLLWIFDGSSLYTDTTILAEVSGFSIGTDWNPAYQQGLAVYTNTIAGSQITRKFYLCNSTGCTKIYEAVQDSSAVLSDVYPIFSFYFDANKLFVRTVRQFDGAITKLEIVDLDGTIESEIVIDADSYPSYDFNHFGTKNLFLRVYNGSDNTIPHKIWTYDGISNTVRTAQIAVENYNNVDSFYRNRSYSSTYDYAACENVLFIFFNYVSDSNGMTTVDNCKLVCFFAGQDPFVYSYALGADKSIYLNDIGISKNFFLLVVDPENDGTLSSMVMTASGAPTLVDLGHPIDGLDDIDVTEVGERIALVVEYDVDETNVVETIVHSYNSDGSKAGGILELDTPSHSTDINYDTYLVSGDGKYNFLTPSGSWSEYPRYSQEYTADFHTATGLTTAPYIYTESENRIYYFSDQGFNSISDGGSDMYDGGNMIYTNVGGGTILPYTHTQLSISGEVQEEDYIKNGAVQDGSGWFGAGTSYFTNMYPGFFVMVAKGTTGINITEFKIDGDVGADGNGEVSVATVNITGYSKNYTAYVKKVFGAGDPSINQIIIVDTNSPGIIQNVDSTSEDDFHQLLGLGSASEIHYLLLAKASGLAANETEIENIIFQYLEIVDGNDINSTLAGLNSNYTNVISQLPPKNSLKLSRVFKGNGEVVSLGAVSSNVKRFGRNGFYFLNQDPEDSDNWKVTKYSLDSSIVSQVNTGQPDLQDSYYIENRAIVITSESVTGDPNYLSRKIHLLGENSYDIVQADCVETSDYRLIINDWGWYVD